MVDHAWFWFTLGAVFYILCPYTLVITAGAAIETDTMAIYRIGSVIAWCFLAEACLCILTPLSRTVAGFHLWFLRQLLFVRTSP